MMLAADSIFPFISTSKLLVARESSLPHRHLRRAQNPMSLIRLFAFLTTPSFF